ncbi:MAG: hypothetical protein IT164_20290 [Bryobacterales bacterium]|nr:hypothetical protein [Bryobacterales bacterium]
MIAKRRESNITSVAVAAAGKRRRAGVWAWGVCLAAMMGVAWADVSNCGCDPALAETMARRECSLCVEAEKHPEDKGVFLLKDINPRKPNRWLALTRRHTGGAHALQDLTRGERVALLKAAVEKGRALFGEEWGIAYNSWRVRTQCHAHLHIGKLLRGLAPGNYVDVARIEEIPTPKGDSGFWIHAVGTKFRVHYGEDITETALLR